MSFIDSILDNLDEALVITDAYGKILFFNKIAADINNAAMQMPLSVEITFMDAASPLRKGIVTNLFAEIRRTKKPAKSFAEYKGITGDTIYLEFKHIPVTDESNEVSHIHSIFRDITPQKVFEKKLTTQAANINNLIDKANAIIIGVDTRGYITDWNDYCSIITGYKKTDVFAKKFSEIVLKEENRADFEYLLLRVMSHEVVTNHEVYIWTQDGLQRTWLLNSSIRTSEAGSIIGIVFVGQDATELMEYRNSLEQQVHDRTFELQQALAKEKEIVDLKSRFVSIASHEFRTPLSSIEHAAGFLRSRKELSSTELNLKLDIIEKQIKHMSHLLDDVLTYGKSEAGKIKLIVTQVALMEFIQKIVEDVGHSTKGTHGIELRTSQLPDQITTDEKLFRNIIINLLTNAIKFSPGKAYVYLTVTANRNKLTMTVKDDGIGIAEEELTKIFEPFERSKRVESIQGTGLGLSIVKKALELLSGTIEVNSELGRGTTFTVTIPIQAHEK
jgi:PAS domain S-box-containing protein